MKRANIKRQWNNQLKGPFHIIAGWERSRMLVESRHLIQSVLLRALKVWHSFHCVLLQVRVGVLDHFLRRFPQLLHHFVFLLTWLIVAVFWYSVVPDEFSFTNLLLGSNRKFLFIKKFFEAWTASLMSWVVFGLCFICFSIRFISALIFAIYWSYRHRCWHLCMNSNVINFILV